MDWFNLSLRACVSGWAALFGDAHPMVSLIPLSVLAGLGMLWVFKKTSDQARISVIRKRMQARLLELRLYGDDPRQLWRSQVALLADNLRYMGLMLKPALFLAPPMVILLVHLDFVYGLAPLELGRRAVLTVQTAGRISTRTKAPELSTPPGVSIETPAVRAAADGRFSWGLAAFEEGQSTIEINFDGKRFSKEITAGPPGGYVSPRRVSSMWSSFLYPGEELLANEAVEWVEINYGVREISAGGIELHWLIWFFVISMAAGYLFKGYFGVTI